MGFTGKTQNINTTPEDIRGLRNEAVQYLLGSGFGGIQNQSPTQVQGVDDKFFMEQILGPYRQMFEQSRGGALAQAKESAGNLTGSGYNNLFGNALSQSLAGEQQALAQTRMGLRGQEQQYNLGLAGMENQRRNANAQNFLQMLMGFGTTGVGPQQMAYKPGFVDYYTSVLGGAARAAAGAGG